VVYDKYKTALVSDPRHKIALIDHKKALDLRSWIFKAREKSTLAIRWLGSDTRAVFLLYSAGFCLQMPITPKLQLWHCFLECCVFGGKTAIAAKAQYRDAVEKPYLNKNIILSTIFCRLNVGCGWIKIYSTVNKKIYLFIITQPDNI
jgi:hypothetical protein